MDAIPDSYHTLAIITFHKKNISLSHHVCVGKTQTYQLPQDRVGEYRVVVL